MNVWYAVTLLGSPELWAAVAVVVALAYWRLHGQLPQAARKRFEYFVIVFALSVVLTFAATAVLKVGFNAPRPCVPCESAAACNSYCPEDPFSFPSGHAAAIFAAFTAGWVGTRHREDKRRRHELERPRWYPALVAVPLLVAASRVMLGVHRPEDVIVGAAIGVFVSFIVARVARRYITA